jgi:hypothetical protein
LNLEKSKYAPGTAPKSQTSVFAAAGQGLKVTTTTLTVSGVNAQGQKVNTVALYIKK